MICCFTYVNGSTSALVLASYDLCGDIVVTDCYVKLQRFQRSLLAVYIPSTLIARALLRHLFRGGPLEGPPPRLLSRALGFCPEGHRRPRSSLRLCFAMVRLVFLWLSNLGRAFCCWCPILIRLACPGGTCLPLWLCRRRRLLGLVLLVPLRVYFRATIPAPFDLW